MYIYVKIHELDDVPEVPNPAELIEKIVGEPCMSVACQDVNRQLIAELQPRAIIVSGMATDIQKYSKEVFRELNYIVKELNIPSMFICGSHQLLAELYNKDFEKVERLYCYPIEDDDKKPRLRADGFFKIRQVGTDPIFLNMPEEMYMKCSHYCEVKQVPTQFERIASSDHSVVEAMKHKDRPLYGIQFHPEKYNASHPDGAIVLLNFSKLVTAFWNSNSSAR